MQKIRPQQCGRIFLANPILHISSEKRNCVVIHSYIVISCSKLIKYYSLVLCFFSENAFSTRKACAIMEEKTKGLVSMQNFTFPAFCIFGKGDSGETFVDVELSNAEANKLIQYGTQESCFYEGFAHCEELKELYGKIYEIAIKQITDELRGTGWLDEHENDNPDFRADDVYVCGVMFPEEFEEMLSEND